VNSTCPPPPSHSYRWLDTSFGGTSTAINFESVLKLALIYYFQRPDRITSDPPPPPYVDTNRLRAAFSKLQLFTGSDGDSVHGEFGRADG
jgi:hypothetical protein